MRTGAGGGQRNTWGRGAPALTCPQCEVAGGPLTRGGEASHKWPGQSRTLLLGDRPRHPRLVSVRRDSPPAEPLVPAPTSADRPPEIPLLGELLELTAPGRSVGPAAQSFAPLVSWLIATAQPRVAVELGTGERTSLLSMCDALSSTAQASRVVLVRLAEPEGSETVESEMVEFADLVSECADRFTLAVSGYVDEESARAEVFGASGIELLHCSLFDLDEHALPDLTAWFDACAPGAVIVVTTTSGTASSAYSKATAAVAPLFPTVRVPLGGGTEALVAQVPVEGSAPIVARLRNVPAAVTKFLAVLGEPVDDGAHIGDEALPAGEVRAVVASILERQNLEREAMLSALQAYKDYAAGLTAELDATRKDAATQMESARLEREYLVREFLDRADVLSAKLSTTASRLSAELADKDRLLEAQERKVLAYAGQAADAQSVIDDLQRSSSWRVTAPLRLFSRIMARRATNAAD